MPDWSRSALRPAALVLAIALAAGAVSAREPASGELLGATMAAEFALQAGRLDEAADAYLRAARAAPDACIAKRGSGEIAPLPGQTSGVFVPRTILGVNAASKQPDMARAFLELVLSEQVQ